VTRVECLHLPYYCFDVTVRQDDETHTVTVAADGVLAATVFFVEASLPRVRAPLDQSCPFVAGADQARETVLREYRSLLLEHGLRSRRSVAVESVSEPEQVHYPFWVGYFRKRSSYDFKALDAVSGELQGVRMRKVFLAAFREMAPTTD
jgi:hypothetical protein